MAVYAVSDLHGCMHFYNEIKKFLKPEDKVYFLGDAGDRGIEPWETIKAVAKDPQFVYMMGNHEDMLWKAMDEFMQGGCGWDFQLLAHNGGASTFDGWLSDGADEHWKHWLMKLPRHIEYINTKGQTVILTHAGYTPDRWGNKPKLADMVWSREHFDEPWDEELPDTYIVHGHTPTPLLNAYDVTDEQASKPGALTYCDGHKMCIDNGAVWTGFCTLLDLDTFESTIFTATADEIGVD